MKLIKKPYNYLLLGFMVLVATGYAAGINQVEVPISEIYVDSEYVEGGVVDIGIEAMLPSNCYVLGDIEVFLKEGRLLSIRAFAIQKAPSTLCVPRLVAVKSTVKVKGLKQGGYIAFSNRTEASFLVESSNTNKGADATPVFIAKVVKNQDGQNQLHLEGEFPNLINGCMVVESFEESYYLEGQTLRVKPVATLLDSCPDNYSYEYKSVFNLPEVSGDIEMIRLNQTDLPDLVILSEY
jgi:hypothetical protein